MNPEIYMQPPLALGIVQEVVSAQNRFTDLMGNRNVSPGDFGTTYGFVHDALPGDGADWTSYAYPGHRTDTIDYGYFASVLIDTPFAGSAGARNIVQIAGRRDRPQDVVVADLVEVAVAVEEDDILDRTVGGAVLDHAQDRGAVIGSKSGIEEVEPRPSAKDRGCGNSGISAGSGVGAI